MPITGVMHIFDPNLILKARLKVIGALVLLLVVFMAGISQLTLSSDYRIFFGPSNPHLKAFDSLQNNFTKNDNVFFILTAKEGDVFTPQIMSAVLELTEQAWQLPFSIRVDSLTNFQRIQGQQDELQVADVIDPFRAYSQAELSSIKHYALQEPMLVQRLLSSDAKITGVLATIQLPDDDQNAIKSVVMAARNVEQALSEKYPFVEVRTTGIVMQNYAFTEASEHDLSLLIPLMLLLILVGVGMAFRSPLALVGSVSIVMLSIISAFGFAGWLGIAISPVTMAAPTMIMTLAIADSVHIMSTFYHAWHQGNRTQDALALSYRRNSLAIVYTSITTAIGFLTFHFSDSPPFHDLGNMVAFGVLMALLFTFTVLPLILMLEKKPRPSLKPRLKPCLAGLAKQIHKAPKRMLVICIIIMSSLIAFIPKNQLNDEWIGYFDKSMAFRQHADYTIEHLTGLSALYFGFSAGAPGKITEPQYLEKLEAFTQWLAMQPEVLHVSSINDILKRINKSLHNDDPSYFRLPQTKAMAAQYILLYELSLPYGLDLNNQINVDRSQTRIEARIKKLSTNALLELEQRIHEWQIQHLPEKMFSPATGPEIMFAHIGFSNIRNMLIGTIIALLMISAVLMVVFRSLYLGFLSILTNLLPIAVGFGLWGVVNAEIGLSLSVVAAMTIGIVVDDTIHLLNAYRLAIREGKSNYIAISEAFERVGSALFVTTVVLVIGFLTLTLSSFKLNSSMGLLTAITIAIALAIDFIFLPAMLLFREENNERSA